MNSIFTEENLLAFTMAARYRSFSKAAKELGLTTSAISYTIKRMEMGLDVVLFTRTTRSIEPVSYTHLIPTACWPAVHRFPDASVHRNRRLCCATGRYQVSQRMFRLRPSRC